MKLELKIQLLKFSSAVFNCIFLLLGLAVGGCGIWMLFDGGNFLTLVSSAELRTVALGLLVIGGVVAAVSIVGCVGAEGGHRFLLLTYLLFLILLVLAQLFVTLLLLVNRNKIEQGVDEAVDRIVVRFGTRREDSLLDDVQRYGRCCGRTGPADWLKNVFVRTLNLTEPDVLPCSCFGSAHPSSNSSWCSELANLTGPLVGRGNGPFDQGCEEKLSAWLQENSLTVVAMDIGLILIQVLLFAVSLQLFLDLRRKSSPTPTSRLVDSGHAPSEEPDGGEQNYAYEEAADGYADPRVAYHHGNRHQAYWD